MRVETSEFKLCSLSQHSSFEDKCGILLPYQDGVVLIVDGDTLEIE